MVLLKNTASKSILIKISAGEKQVCFAVSQTTYWIPAFAGMTKNGMRTKFDLEKVLIQVGTAVVMETLAPMEGGLIDSELNHVVEGQKVDIEKITASAIGSSIGSEVGTEIGKDIKESEQQHHPQTPSSYKQAQQNSVGRNKSSFFSNSNQKDNSIVYTKDKNGHVIEAENRNPFPRLQNDVPSLSQILKENPNLSIAAQGPSGAELYDKASEQYFVYDSARGISHIDVGTVDSVHPELWAMGALDGIKLGMALFKGSVGLLGRMGLFGEDIGVNSFKNPEGWYHGSVTSKQANFMYEQEGMSAPYGGARGRDIVLQEDREFVRLHGERNQSGFWIARPEEIEGLTPQQIQDKFALPNVPQYVSDVSVPSGTALRLGSVAPQTGWGIGGGTQYEILSNTEIDWFVNRRELGGYNTEIYNQEYRISNSW